MGGQEAGSQILLYDFSEERCVCSSEFKFSERFSDSCSAPGPAWSAFTCNFTAGKKSLKNCSSRGSMLTKNRINPMGEQGTWSPFLLLCSPLRVDSPLHCRSFLQSSSPALKHEAGAMYCRHGYLPLREISGILWGDSEISNFFCLRLSL